MLAPAAVTPSASHVEKDGPCSPFAENVDLAARLERIAQLLTIQRASPFRARAYHDAAVEIRQLRQPVRRILEVGGSEGLDALPAIGPSIASLIREFLLTGQMRLLSRLEGQLAPEDLFLTLPGIGEELARRLHERLGIESLEELELAAHDGRLQRVPGFGPRRTRALRDLLAARLGRSLERTVPAASAAGSSRVPAPRELPDVASLLAVDAEYRERAARGELHHISPRRFNPLGEAWLPILHTERAGWHFTALFSNSARAHELHRTRDWVVIYYSRDGQEGQCTVVTEWHGSLSGRRVVRGREPECRASYDHALPGAAPGEDPAAEAAERDSAATVRALRSAAGHPGSAGPIETIETHQSWVFMTPSHAYKLKKPARTERFDYTTSDARRAACEAELQLNQRLAASVYLDVVPVRRDDTGRHVGGHGEVVDWLVRMRRLRRDSMLDAYIVRQDVRDDQLRELARVLVRFYAASPSAGLTGAEYRQLLAAELSAKYACLARPRYDLDRQQLRSLYDGLMRWMAEHAARVDARAPLVREAHGDLRPEHICLEPEPVIIDCLDFDRALRLLDPLSELAFLDLESRRLGNEWLGTRIIQCYAQLTSDHADADLLAFYRGYHALVRAALAAMRLDAPGEDLNKWRTRAAAYLQLALAPR